MYIAPAGYYKGRPAPCFRGLVASVYAPNVASVRVLENNGFVLEGRLREHRVGRDGVIMDELVYGLMLTDVRPNAGVV